jgi:hypothetical protein
MGAEAEGQKTAGPEASIKDCGDQPVACEICFERTPKDWTKSCPDVGESGKNHNYLYVDSTGKKCYRALDPADFEYKRDRKCRIEVDTTKKYKYMERK